MARMIPKYVSRHTESSAERRLFTAIQEGLSDQWTVLHSLPLVQGTDTRWGETDFVLIGPYGIYCLEAKGNRIRFDGGQWYSGESELNKSPFEQASGASSNVFNYLREKHPDPSRRCKAAAYPSLFQLCSSEKINYIMLN